MYIWCRLTVEVFGAGPKSDPSLIKHDLVMYLRINYGTKYQINVLGSDVLLLFYLFQTWTDDEFLILMHLDP